MRSASDRRNWTPEAEEILTRMYNDGARDWDVYRALQGKYSRQAISNKRSRMGLIRKNMSEAVKAWRQAKKETSAPFDAVAASIMHLVDLKRAGHSPRFTELNIPRDDGLPWRHMPEPCMLSYSPAAACAEA
jgi:hypothetical protein